MTDNHQHILVTGASGLLGRELIRQLLGRGAKVRALVHKQQPDLPAHPNLAFFRGDILDTGILEDALEGIHTVYHCAALISYDHADVSDLYKINVEGTANLVNASLDAGVQAFIHVSSVAALGKNSSQESIDENTVWTKETSSSRYGESKYLAELEVWRGMAEGLPSLVVNPSVILGAGNWTESSTRLFAQAYREFPWSSHGVTGFVDVRDVARAMIELAAAEAFGQRIILNGAHASFHELLSMMANCFGKKPPKKILSPALASLLWRAERIRYLFTGKKPLVTRETARAAVSVSRYHNGKLFSLLPQFSYHPLEETIRFTCTSLMESLQLEKK